MLVLDETIIFVLGTAVLEDPNSVTLKHNPSIKKYKTGNVHIT